LYIRRIEPGDKGQVKLALDEIRPDGFVCANDFTAAHLLKMLNGLGVSVPDQVRMAGIDDVKYASLLSVPLTTIHQPCADMGAVAIGTMLQRLRHPTLPPRDVLLSGVGVDARGIEARRAIQELGLDARLVQSTGFTTGIALVHGETAGHESFTIERPAAYDAIELSAALIGGLVTWNPAWLYYGT